MKVLFASGDVGGARALLPVMAECRRKELPFMTLNHGHISRELPSDWERIASSQVIGREETFFREHEIRTLVFASSVKDPTALALARQARKAGVESLHVLDNWTGYRKRMEVDGLPMFKPDYYTVMDELAQNASLAEGVSASCLVVTGQPALASLREEIARKISEKDNILPKLKKDPRKKHIVFVSEPVALDQGNDPESPHYRGYTENEVLRCFCEALLPFADKIRVSILPHPRENIKKLAEHWEACRAGLEGDILLLGKGRTSLATADGVVGMASILLYESWLLGIPTASLQPGLRLDTYRSFQCRQGLFFADTAKSVAKSTDQLVSQALVAKNAVQRPELANHEQAPRNVFELVNKTMGCPCDRPKP